MVLGVAVPVVGAGAAIIALTQLLGWCIAFGLLYLYRRTLSAILLGVADAIDGIAVGAFGRTVRLGGPIAAAFRRADGAITQALENWIRGAEIALAFFWDQLAENVEWLGQTIADLADTTAGAISTVVRQEIPAATKRAVAQAQRGVQAVAGDVARLTTVALPGIRADVRGVGGQVGRLGDVIRGLRSRVNAHGRLLTGAGITGLVMIALRRMGLGFLRCGNLRKTGRRLCGLDPRLLDAMLVLPLALAGTISIERTARELLAQSETVELALRRGFKELRALPPS